MFQFFKNKPSSFLGVDIGSSSIKIVQLVGGEEGMKLENYVIIEELNCLDSEKNQKAGYVRNMSADKIVSNIVEVIKEAEITADKIAMAIPISSAFSSIIHLPDVPEDEIPGAVSFEARQYIPIPVDEVVFGWNVISREGTKETNHNDHNVDRKRKRGIKILLVATPKDITNRYTNIAKMLKLDLLTLETESFSLARSLVGQRKGSFTIVDIGNNTTDITIVEDGKVILSHSVSGIGGVEITKIISHGFSIDLNRAESLKKDVGLKFTSSNKKVSEIISPIVSIIVSETRKINDTYYRNNNKKISEIILTGGSSRIPELIDYIADGLKIKVRMGNPWQDIAYDKILSEKLEKMSPYFSVAVGLAMKGFEK